MVMMHTCVLILLCAKAKLVKPAIMIFTVMIYTARFNRFLLAYSVPSLDNFIDLGSNLSGAAFLVLLFFFKFYKNLRFHIFN